MSADRWAVCPRCLPRAHEEKARLEAEAQTAYGKVSVEEFDALRRRADEFSVAPDTYTSFREDREIGVNLGSTDGRFVVTYGGSCEHCGLEFSYEHSEPVPT